MTRPVPGKEKHDRDFECLLNEAEKLTSELRYWAVGKSERDHSLLDNQKFDNLSRAQPILRGLSEASSKLNGIIEDNHLPTKVKQKDGGKKGAAKRIKV